MEPMETMPVSQVSPKEVGEGKRPSISVDRQSRIKKTQKMRLAGAKVSEIANYFNVSTKTIYRDIRDTKVVNQSEVRDFDQDNFLGESIIFWRLIRSKSMRDSELCQEENAKIGHRRNAMSAQEKMEKGLQESGLLTKVPEKLEISNVPFGKKAVREAALDFVKLINEIGTGDAEPTE